MYYFVHGYIRKDIFTGGIGTAIIAREMPNGHLGCSTFLLDVWCLGLKNTYFTVLSPKEYQDRLEEIGAMEELEIIHPSCVRKIIEQCIERKILAANTSMWSKTEHYSDVNSFKYLNALYKSV